MGDKSWGEGCYVCVKMPLGVSVEGVAAGSFVLGDLWNTLNLRPRHTYVTY